MSDPRVGPYELQGELGRGAAGAVYRARDPRTGQEVALKLLAAANDERSRRRFELEARALVRLRHPNVAAMLDAGEEAGRPWLALELVRGRSLQARLDREGPLRAREAAALVLGLARGLAHAHAMGVLHRDLKPGNVLLPDDGGPPRLVDFGVAGFQEELSRSRLTRTGSLLGTPGYWSPEAARGEAGAAGAPADVYGLGALLYAALTGGPPHTAVSLPELLVRTEHERPAPATSDRALERLVQRCLAKRPEDRPPSADAVAEALARYLAAPPAHRQRRTRAALGAAGVALVVALLAGGVALAARSRPSGPATPPPPPPTPPVDVAAVTTAAPATTAPVASASTAAEVSELLALAMRIGKKEPGRALAAVERALLLEPDNARLHNQRGVALAQAGDERAALAAYDRAVELAPDLALVRTNRASTYLLLRRTDDALADLERALTLEPTRVQAWEALAGAKLSLGAWAEAAQAYDRVLELDPRRPIHQNRAAARLFSGQNAGAAADYDVCLASRPDDPDLLGKRAAARGRAGDLAGAKADLDRVAVLRPDQAGTLYQRAEVHALLGDRPAARADLDRSIELDPSFGGAWLRRASVRMADDPEGAHADAQQAAAIDPELAAEAAALIERLRQ